MRLLHKSFPKFLHGENGGIHILSPLKTVESVENTVRQDRTVSVFVEKLQKYLHFFARYVIMYEKGVTETMTENLPDELYGVLADLLNRKNNMAVLDSIRGEYGVLNCLSELEEGASAGVLCKRLHVVPGRMADILKRLEQKELIERVRMENDRRVVKAHITEKGRKISLEKREEIHRDYEGLFRILGEHDVRELIRLLKIVLSYYPDKSEDGNRL